MQRVNARMETLFGYARGDLLGQSMDKLLPERFRARHKGHQAHFFADPHARPMGTGLELSARHQSGAEFPVEISLTPLRTPAGNVVVAAIRDVSERRAAEVQLAQLGKILETSLNEIYLFDAHTLRFALVNRGARDNLGYSLDELRTRTPLDLTPDFTPATFGELLGPLRSGEKKDLEFRTKHRRKDGSSYPAQVHLQLYGGKPEVFIAIVMDISQRVRDERALREGEQRLALHVRETPLAVIEWRLERPAHHRLEPGCRTHLRLPRRRSCRATQHRASVRRGRRAAASLRRGRTRGTTHGPEPDQRRTRHLVRVVHHAPE